MITPRSLRQSHAAGSTKKTDKDSVYLYKYDFREGDGVKVNIPKKDPSNPESFTFFLNYCTKNLDVPRNVQRIFTEDDRELTSLAEIEPNMKLYCSMTAAPIDEAEKPLYKSRLPVKVYTLPQLPEVPQPEHVPKPEDAVSHQIIAASQNTVKENLRDSLLALYSSLSPAHRSKLPCADSLQKLSQDTQEYVFEDSLFSQFIGPTQIILDTPLGQETNAWAMERFKGLSPEDCKFSITGPPQSGKSTLLSIMTSLFYQRLQLTNLTSKYLIFPLNWQLQQIYVEDVQKLYVLFATNTINLIKSVHMELTPIVPQLIQFFVSLTELPVLPVIPPAITRMPGFPTTAVGEIAARIHSAWNLKTSTPISKEDLRDNGFSQFIELTFSLPDDLARAFGFECAVYVFDHFDCAGLELEPPERFKTSAPASLPEALKVVLDRCPFFVASFDDGDFFRYFDSASVGLSTEHLIVSADTGARTILVANPHLALEAAACGGCPGYLSLFARVCEIASRAPSTDGKRRRMRSVVDASRTALLRRELLRLCALVHAANEDAVPVDVLEALEDAEEIEVELR